MAFRPCVSDGDLHEEKKWKKKKPFPELPTLPDSAESSLKYKSSHVLMNTFDNLPDYGNFFPLILNTVLAISLIVLQNLPIARCQGWQLCFSIWDTVFNHSFLLNISLTAEEAQKLLRTLTSIKAPMAKKRQVMRATFGDYRNKMHQEERQHKASKKQIKFFAIQFNSIQFNFYWSCHRGNSFCIHAIQEKLITHNHK